MASQHRPFNRACPPCREWGGSTAPLAVLLGFSSRICCWGWYFVTGSIPRKVGMWVSDPWCMASSKARDSPSFLEWSHVCHGEQSCSSRIPGQALAQGGMSLRDVLRAWSPPAPQSLLAEPARHRLKEKMVQNPVGFWWE